ncbi:mechanosensitive ion channel family protein [Neptunicella marina]|uniref:Mechanosensitive ion channel family protein n=2 Tax=Neptunicella marina TaxID=2125989 RepID=A0A8J6ITJ2_9ALTE|nr:mechanosensitive ion channel family protein [Neptunicella marina]
MLAQLSQYKLLVSLAVLLLFILLKYATVQLIKRNAKKKGKDKRDLVNTIKNLLNFLIIIVVLNLWADELQKFAFSIAAFMVAIVLATREFIQCLLGFIYLASTRPFRVGDWIQIGDHCGEVTATDWTKLTILEVDMETYNFSGKTLILPNSLLINQPIKNLNYLKRYVSHHFVITRDMSVNPYNFIDELTQKAAEHCQHFHDVAIRYSQIIEKRLEVSIPGPEAHIYISTSNLGDTCTEFTIFCPTEQALEIEQKITQDFFNLWFTEKARLETAKSE